jgi:hypothetical protein
MGADEFNFGHADTGPVCHPECYPRKELTKPDIGVCDFTYVYWTLVHPPELVSQRGRVANI